MARLFLSALMLIVFGSMVSAQGSYKIKSGDTLTIEVLEDPTLNRSALVLPDGTVSIPLVGSVAARGRTLSAVQAAIISGLTPNFASAPNVFVTVEALAVSTTTGSSTMNVFVIGAVITPGKIAVTRGTTLLQFLAESGGLNQFAAKKRIQVRRKDRGSGKYTMSTFNFDAIEKGLASPQTIVLKSGDVIIVPERRLFE